MLARYIERPFCNIQMSACCSLEELYTLYAFSSLFPLCSSSPQLFAFSPLPKSVLCSRFMYGKHFPAPLKKCFLCPRCYSASPPSARAVLVECDRKKKSKAFWKAKKAQSRRETTTTTATTHIEKKKNVLPTYKEICHRCNTYT